MPNSKIKIFYRYTLALALCAVSVLSHAQIATNAIRFNKMLELKSPQALETLANNYKNPTFNKKEKTIISTCLSQMIYPSGTDRLYLRALPQNLRGVVIDKYILSLSAQEKANLRSKIIYFLPNQSSLIQISMKDFLWLSSVYKNTKLSTPLPEQNDILSSFEIIKILAKHHYHPHSLSLVSSISNGISYYSSLQEDEKSLQENIPTNIPPLALEMVFKTKENQTIVVYLMLSGASALDTGYFLANHQHSYTTSIGYSFYAIMPSIPPASSNKARPERPAAGIYIPGFLSRVKNNAIYLDSSACGG